jgi:NAD(P)H-quinone oxidoreductase subunit 4
MMGFISEFLVFRGSFAVFPVQTLLCMVGTGLTAVYFLLLVNRTFFGRLPDQFANLPAVHWQERLPGFVLVILIIALGLQPGWLVRWSETTTTAMLMTVATIGTTTTPTLDSANSPLQPMQVSTTTADLQQFQIQPVLIQD